MSDEPTKDQENEVEAHGTRAGAKPGTRALSSEPTDELEENEVEAHSVRAGAHPGAHPSTRA
jgi:hypothetical protein